MPVQAELIDLGLFDADGAPGGPTVRLIYDADLNITWLGDANFAQTAGYDADGRMTWANAMAWADDLRVGGFTDWRLPTTTQPDATCSNQSGDLLPQGIGLGCTGSEMGHLFNVEGVTPFAPSFFTNVQADYWYWSGTEAVVGEINRGAWSFAMAHGFQFWADKLGNNFWAWAVRDGEANMGAPLVSAGPEQTITFPDVASLDGTVTDDGFPDPPGMVTTMWSKVSGPGTVTFGNVSAVDTTASFSLPGTYVLRLTVNDGEFTNRSDVTIGFINQAPTVNAGPDQTITLPNVASLDGTVGDDGLPSGTVTTTWSKVSGLGPVTFGNVNVLDTSATFSQAGTYVLRLTADDGALTSSAEVTITVNPPWVETVPDIRGLWTEGPSSGFYMGCQNPADNGPFGDPGGETYRITNQTGDSFSISNVDTLIDGRDTVVQATACTGTVAANGTVTAFCTYNVSLNGTFWYNGTYTLTGSLVGNTFTFTVAGQDQVGDTCQWTQSRTDTRSGPIPPPVPILRWSIAGIGDLDGNSTADLLWRDRTTGAVAAWFMDGLTVTSSVVLATISADWIIAGIGDLDNNGTEDVVWRHPTSGTVAAWYMTLGTGAVERGDVLATGLPEDWIITGMGDLDGNDTADVVWRHVPSGLVAAWYMTSGTGAIDRPAVLATIPPDWLIGGVGDLDDNGTADVLWRHPTSGTVAAWYMTPATGAVGPSKVLASGLPGDWLIGDIGDLDANGTADVIWRHVPSGLVAAWLMTPGTGEVGTSDVISTIPPDWNIAGMGDLNLGNGPADVVWHHPSSGLTAGWLMNGLTVDDSGVIEAP